MNPNVFILPAVWISAFLCPLVLTAKLGSVEGFDLDAIKTETVKMLIEFGRPKFQSSFNGSDNMFKSWIQGFTIAHGHLGYKLVYGRDAVEDAGPGVKNVTKKFIDFKKTGGKRKG